MINSHPDDNITQKTRKMKRMWPFIIGIAVAVCMVVFLFLSTDMFRTQHRIPAVTEKTKTLPLSQTDSTELASRTQSHIPPVTEKTMPSPPSQTDTTESTSRTQRHIPPVTEKTIPLPPSQADSTESIFTIQAGSFINIADAAKQFDAVAYVLDEKKLDYLRIEKVGKYYSVRIGKFKDYATAEKLLQAIKPRLSPAIILKAYIKNDRIMRLYKNLISSASKELYNFD
jgi:cell division protein FtsN